MLLTLMSNINIVQFFSAAVSSQQNHEMLPPSGFQPTAYKRRCKIFAGINGVPVLTKDKLFCTLDYQYT